MSAQLPLPTVSIVKQDPPNGQMVKFTISVKQASDLTIDLKASTSGAASTARYIPLTYSNIASEQVCEVTEIEAGTYSVSITATNGSGTTTIAGTTFTILGAYTPMYEASVPTMVAPPDTQPETPGNPNPPTGPYVPPPASNEIMTVADRVKDSTTTVGTGSFALSGTPDPNFRVFQTPPIVVGATVPYIAVHRTLPEWENGEGKLTAALTLERVRVTSSSNNNAPVNFSAGVKDISCDLTADFVNRLAGVDSVATSTVNSTSSCLLMVEQGITKQISFSDATAGFSDLAVLPAPSIPSDEIAMFRGNTEYRTSLTVLAAAIAAIIGSAPTADISVPTINSVLVTNSEKNIVVVNFSEVLGSMVPPNGAFTFASGKTVTDLSLTGNQARLTVSAAYAYGDTDSVTYTKPASGGLVDPSNNPVASVTMPIVNSIAAPGSSVSGVSVSPGTVSIQGNQTQQFTANVAGTGSPSQSVTWTVSGGGSISGSGLFTAPAANGANQTITIIATSAQDNTKSGTATLTVLMAAPNAPTIGNAVGGDGYVDVAFTPAITGTAATSYTATLSSGETNTGTSSPIRVLASNGTSRTASVKATNTGGDSPSSAASNTVTPTTVVAYTITGYQGNAVKDTYDASAVTVNAGTKAIRSGAFTNANLYLNIAPTPALNGTVSGWSNSATVPPEILSDVTQNTTYTNPNGRTNGAIPMSKPSAWSSDTYLVVANGSGTSRWYLWVKPADGVWQCFSPAGILVTGA